MADSPAPTGTFVPPSVLKPTLLTGASTTYFSPVPPALLPPPSGEQDGGAASTATGPACCLGVDEAGRGPVLGPMVYGVFYLPLDVSDALLRSDAHRFDDSKVLTASFRSELMRQLCTEGTDLHRSCGWATRGLSARDISAGMMRPATTGAYNLNAQALDATVDLVRGVYDRGVNVQEIYVDTVGQPAAYQAKLQRHFPTAKITVTKKADSLFACVSAASVCAKVTRDAALETMFEAWKDEGGAEETATWGSGYPGDSKTVNHLKSNMHPVFGWGNECRFSWNTAKDMIEGKGPGIVKVDWPADDDGETSRVTDFFSSGDDKAEKNELGAWYGTSAGLEAF